MDQRRLYWSTIEGRHGHLHQYGFGDVTHFHENLWEPSGAYLLEYISFYQNSYPKLALMAEYIFSRLRRDFDPYRDYLTNHRLMPFVPLVASFLPDDTISRTHRAQALLNRLPRARYFPYLGQTFMNSHRSPQGTYALFVGGGQTTNHKKWDENHFVIYRGGFLALDAGTRTSTGHDVPGAEAHRRNFGWRTVSGNTILIYMEGEIFPAITDRFRGVGVVPEANDGGQRRPTGSVIQAFETNEHFTYLASDATAAYHPQKADSVMRQFVYVYPDYFVIYDRVASKRPEQRKTWILQTQSEPVIQAETVRIDHWEGRMFSRTLLPQKADVTAIGGQDRFWVDGKSWETQVPDHALMGNWRIEVAPADEANQAHFLHVLQVGAQDELQRMVPTELMNEEAAHGVRFKTLDGRSVELSFQTQGATGGWMRMLGEDGAILHDAALTTSVQSQEGLDLKP